MKSGAAEMPQDVKFISIMIWVLIPNVPIKMSGTKSSVSPGLGWQCNRQILKAWWVISLAEKVSSVFSERFHL